MTPDLHPDTNGTGTAPSVKPPTQENADRMEREPVSEPLGPRQCSAKSKQSGERCKRWATPGASVCATHGSKAPQVKAAAERRLEQDRAQRAAATFGLPVDVEPHAALLDELHRTAGHVAWLGDLIQLVEDPGRLTQYTEAGRRPDVWVEMYQAERKHLAAVATACIKAGIEERRVEIAKQQADVLVSVLRGVLDDLGVGDRPDVPAVVARHLRAVAS